MEEQEKLTPAQKGVHRRRMAIIILIFVMFYGAYAIVFDKIMNEIYISSMIVTGGALLGIGKLKSDRGE